MHFQGGKIPENEFFEGIVPLLFSSFMPNRPYSLLLCVFVLIASPGYAADSLPDRISNDTFVSLMQNLSEPSGSFLFENFVSNEPSYADLLRDLSKTTKPDGVYIGVGPEQNFNYIAALHPKIAFTVDIRRQNMVEHLMYKALFEMSPNRADFLSRLFSRKRPAGLRDDSTVQELMDAYMAAPLDAESVQQNLENIRVVLVLQRGFNISNDDWAGLERIYKAFAEWGPRVNYSSDRNEFSSARATAGNPSYVVEMNATDSDGRNWSYLSSEASYRVVRDMQLRNLIIPVVGDFAGPKAIRAVGQYLRDHSAPVTTFYVSNVETYLFPGSNGQPMSGAPNGGWSHFIENVSTLPINESSRFVRFLNVERPGRFDAMQQTIQASRDGKIKAVRDLFPGPQ